MSEGIEGNALRAQVAALGGLIEERAAMAQTSPDDTVDEQLRVDRLLFGVSFEERRADGTRRRIDPASVRVGLAVPVLIAEQWPTLTRSHADGGPCPKAAAWLAGLPADTTPEQALVLCPEPGWLVWLFARSGPDGAVPPSGGAIMATLAYGEGLLWLAETEETRLRHGVRANRDALADMRVAGVEMVDAQVVSLLHRDEGTLGRVRAALWPEMGATS